MSKAAGPVLVPEEIIKIEKHFSCAPCKHYLMSGVNEFYCDHPQATEDETYLEEADWTPHWCPVLIEIEEMLKTRAQEE